MSIIYFTSSIFSPLFLNVSVWDRGAFLWAHLRTWLVRSSPSEQWRLESSEISEVIFLFIHLVSWLHNCFISYQTILWTSCTITVLKSIFFVEMLLIVWAMTGIPLTPFFQWYIAVINLFTLCMITLYHFSQHLTAANGYKFIELRLIGYNNIFHIIH